MKKPIRSLASAFAALAALAVTLAAALAMVACSGDGAVAVTGIELSQKAVSVPIGASVDLLADVKPPNASNKDVTWASSATGVAAVSASGAVTGVTLGSATITVATKDGNFTDTCTVTVTPGPVAVTGVAVSKKIAVAIGGTSLVSAEVLPHGATNKAITWSVAPEGVVSVAGNAWGADVTGIAAGTATVTATTADGGKTASCEVTVGQSLLVDVYEVYFNNLLVNNEFHPLNGEYYFLAIFADSAGVVHATAVDAYTYHAVYLNIRDREASAPTVLPYAPNSVQSDPYGLFVTLDGKVYVAYIDWADDGVATAMLWCDGQNIPLQGASDIPTGVRAVCVADGNVYVVGGESEDGWSYSTMLLWINGEKTSYPDYPVAGTAVAAIGDDIYVAVGGEMMMKVDATAPQRHEILGQYYQHSDDERETRNLTGLTASKGILYACGYTYTYNDDESQEWSGAYWVDHVKQELECDQVSWDGSEATSLCVAPSGGVYVAGAVARDEGDGASRHRGVMWKDGKYLISPEGLFLPKPGSFAVREVAEAAASR
jgi:hypothetical protein